MARVPDAFLSYTRDDDKSHRGFIRSFKERLCLAVGDVTGEPFEIFQDVEWLEWGDDWAEEIQSALSTARFLIPFITPRFFKSQGCRDELELFLRVEKQRKQRNLVMPIYFIETDDIEDPIRRAADPLAEVISGRQFAILTHLRRRTVRHREVQAVVDRVAGVIKRRLAAGPRSGSSRPPPGRGVVSDHGVVPGLPDFVPSTVHDRDGVRDALIAWFERPGAVLAQLQGNRGLGKTAVAAEFARQHLPAVFLTATGFSGVAVGTVLDSLAVMVATFAKRQRLQERLNETEADPLTKLDDVLVTLAADRVLLVVDSAEELIADGRLHDDGLASLFEEIARARGHGVRILFVTTKPVPLPGVEPIPLREGLPPADYAEFVADLTRGNPPILSAGELQRVTRRHPRRTEILVGIPAGAMPASDLLAERDLSTVILRSLDEPQTRAVRALAVYRRPVDVAAVCALTGDPDDMVRPTLTSLVTRRLVRRYDEAHFLLPPEEARGLAGTMDLELLAGLRRRAADHFEAAARSGLPARLDECADWFHAIDLRIGSGNPEHALALMAELDRRYLREWGHSDALVPWLKELGARLTADADRVLHAALYGRALAHQGKLDDAIAQVREAGAGNVALGDTDTQLVLLVQLAGYLFRAGRIRTATDRYQAVITSAPAGHRQVAEARAGLALCQAQTGDLQAAADSIEAALADLAADDRDARLLRVRLWYQRALIDLERGHAERCRTTNAEAKADAETLGADPLVARCLDLEARVRLYQHDPHRAREPAEEACGIAARIGNPDLSRIAGTTLATVLLHLGKRREALVAAGAAARYNRSLFVAEALAVQGVAAFRTGDDRARLAFTEAIRFAEALLIQERSGYRAREAAAISWAGLVLLGSAEEWRAEFAYHQAIEGTGDKPGAQRRRRELFDLLTAERPDSVLRQVRELLD